MFGLKNTLIRETMDRLHNEDNWNPNGNYVPGKQCIVTACHSAAVQRSNGADCNHGPALRAIRKAIGRRYALTRGHSRGLPDIIEFNDHPATDHSDVMTVLQAAEKDTRPFWRKPYQVPLEG